MVIPLPVEVSIKTPPSDAPDVGFPLISNLSEVVCFSTLRTKTDDSDGFRRVVPSKCATISYEPSIGAFSLDRLNLPCLSVCVDGIVIDDGSIVKDIVNPANEVGLL